MKYTFKYMAIALLSLSGAVSCSDFLDRPSEDTYTEATFYLSDEQCEQGVNYLYNSPWFDVIRGYYRTGEGLSGNYYMGGSPYMNFSVNGSDSELTDMSKSLWAVNSNCSTVYNRLKTAACSEETRARLMGEVLTWKAFAYFFLVRSFGDVPIIHDAQAEIAGGKYNQIYKVQKADVYEYIVMTLEKALELLSDTKITSGFERYGRIDYYAAEALLAKVYLTKAGVSGTLSDADLAKAAEYAKDVIDNSGRSLMEEYSDIFRGSNNRNKEALISWHWDASAQPWTTQNAFQSDLAMKGFDEFGDCWGEWNGPSVDLQEAFGVTALQDPSNRPDPDKRRAATMMLAGDKYSYFWRDKGGFDYLKFLYDETYGAGGPGNLCCNTGAACVKFLYGNTADHVAELGVSPARQAYGVSTHILRLADVYLIYAEAKIGASRGSTTDKTALDAFYAVRHRARSNYDYPASISWDDVWKERRLELALEGDRWYDFVRLAYYAPDEAINEIRSQKRNYYDNIEGVYKNYFESGVWDASEASYNTSDAAPAVTASSFTLPFPSEDVVFNPNLSAAPIHVDVRSEYSY